MRVVELLHAFDTFCSFLLHSSMKRFNCCRTNIVEYWRRWRNFVTLSLWINWKLHTKLRNKDVKHFQYPHSTCRHRFPIALFSPVRHLCGIFSKSNFNLFPILMSCLPNFLLFKFNLLVFFCIYICFCCARRFRPTFARQEHHFNRLKPKPESAFAIRRYNDDFKFAIKYLCSANFFYIRSRLEFAKQSVKLTHKIANPQVNSLLIQAQT